MCSRRARWMRAWVLGVLAGAGLPALVTDRPAAHAAEPAKAPAAAIRPTARLPLTPAELYQADKVWTVHFRFTAEAWGAMEPKTGGFGPFGGPPQRGPAGGAGGQGRGPGGGGPGGPGAGPGGPGGGPGNPGGGPGFSFSPGDVLAGIFLRDGDADQDARLTRAEFLALGEKWFNAWDKARSDKLADEQLREGLNAVMLPPGMRPGPGGAPPRMSLQGPEGKRNGLAAMLGIEFPQVKADLEFEGQTFRDVAVRYKGNGTFVESRATGKRSLKVDLNKHVRGQKLVGVSKLNFHNNVTDATWMNESLAYRLFREAGVPAPRTAYARVFVTVPGLHDRKYLGLYSMVENVDGNFAEEVLGAKKGDLFKPVTPDLFADLGDDWKAYDQTYDPKSKPDDAARGRVVELCKFVTHAGDDEFAARIGSFIELENFARFLAVQVLIVDLDGILGPGQNMYLHLHPIARRFTFVPWDQDHSFGQLRGTQEQREQLSILKPWEGRNFFLERMFKVEAFRKLYLAEVERIWRELYRPERIAKQVDELAAAIREAVAEEGDPNRLARFDKAVAGESVGRGGMGGGPFGMTKPARTFVAVRAKAVEEQLAGRSRGLELPGFVFPQGGQRNFGPGTFWAAPFRTALDADKDGSITRKEFLAGFERWFDAWRGQGESLAQEQLKAGINKDLAPRPPAGFGGGFGGAPGAGPGGGAPGGQGPRGR